MKKILIIFIIAAMAFSCGSQKSLTGVQSVKKENKARGIPH